MCRSDSEELFVLRKLKSLRLTGHPHRDPVGDRLDEHRVLVGRLVHLQGHGQSQDLRILPLRLHPDGHLGGQVQRHRVPDLAQVLGEEVHPPAGPGLDPGRPLLHPSVHRLQSGDPSRHLRLQAVHQHCRSHRQAPRAALLPLLLHTLLGPPHHRDARLLYLHHHHNLPENKKTFTGQVNQPA